ncbi:hypothetical protein H4219_003088 [Mycoemilia scoparia]|uniref:Enhancer of translation termination 1 n=1 Tax=Mycoemilia scoparia TaxID=417184 RepID=A0A9W8DTH3_9FUNG|nr:hypothetical protein H4219_003088 [Mycoemilia scoparia]
MSDKTTKKRPMGLKKSRAAKAATTGSQNKRPKDEQSQVINNATPAGMSVDETTEDGGSQLNEDEETIVLEAPEVEEEDNDGQIGEIWGIYQKAIKAMQNPVGISSKQEGGGGDEDLAIKYLRGTIHECDYILKSKYNSLKQKAGSAEGKEGEGEVELVPKFYYVYGMALYTLSELTNPEDAKEYFELSIMRLEQARDKILERSAGDGGRDGGLLKSVYLGLGKSTLSRAKFVDFDKEKEAEKKVVELVNKSLEYFDKALDTETNKEELVKESLIVTDLVFTFVYLFVDIVELQLAVRWGIKKLESIQNGEGQNKKAEIEFSLGNAHWILASHYLDQIDEETGEVPERNTVEKLLTQARDHLKKARENEEEKKTDASESLYDILILLSEVYINLGNIQPEEENQEAEYAKATEVLLVAKKNLPSGQEFPEHLQAFIDESN